VLDVAGVELEEVVYLLREALLKFTHPRREFEIEVSREQAITFIRPWQGDFVEVLPYLPGECPQIVEPAGAA
jgi:hypothetical protein